MQLCSRGEEEWAAVYAITIIFVWSGDSAVYSLCRLKIVAFFMPNSPCLSPLYLVSHQTPAPGGCGQRDGGRIPCRASPAGTGGACWRAGVQCSSLGLWCSKYNLAPDAAGCLGAPEMEMKLRDGTECVNLGLFCKAVLQENLQGEWSSVNRGSSGRVQYMKLRLGKFKVMWGVGTEME